MQGMYKYSVVDKRNKALMNEIYKFRYKTYVEKFEFIDKKHFPDKKEFDVYDEQSIHLIAQDTFGMILGTIRIITKGTYPLPIEQFINIEDSSAEISRLIINIEINNYSNSKTNRNINHIKKSQIKEISLGLYKLLYKESKRLHLYKWYALMEKKLHLLLSFYGFKFEKAGNEVNYYGQVYPYKANISSILLNIEKRDPQLYNFFMN